MSKKGQELMSDDVLKPHRIEPIISEFVPDPDLDALFKQAVAAATQYGWTVPDRAEWEALYKSEIASKRPQ